MRTSEPTIDFSEGFTSQADIFGRKRLYELMMRFVRNSPNTGLVMAIDDKWGNGKTSFLKMLSSEIKNNDELGVNVIYYDAFENDYHTDPFVSLSAEIYQTLNGKESKLDSIKESFVNTGKKVGANLLKGGVSYAITAMTGNLVSGTALEGMKETFANSISDPIEKYVEEKIKSSERDKTELINFKNVLHEIYTKSGRKTLLIIDELDRARPDFSLDLLERIKHIFSVEGFIFLLSVNREQFEKSIEQRYGMIDSRTYLNKFVHFWFTLPKNNVLSKGCINGTTPSTMSLQFSQLDNGVNFLSRNGTIIKTLSYLLDVNGCSLREAERCYSLMNAIDNKEAVGNFSSYVYHSLMALVVYLKVVNPKLLNDIKERNLTKNDVIVGLGIRETDAMEELEVMQLIHLLDYHFATLEELSIARTEKRFSDIEMFNYGNQKRDLFEQMNDVIEHLHIG
ncbi:KAP family P-loop NTPase fold protein [Serratia marcescens]